jgi:hypothetical protein
VQLAMIEWVSAINNIVKKHTLLSVRQSNLNKNRKLLSGGDVIWLWEKWKKTGKTEN